MTIGQGDTLVTPLQLATAYGALENDGKECVPHVLDRVVAPDDTDGASVPAELPQARADRRAST